MHLYSLVSMNNCILTCIRDSIKTQSMLILRFFTKHVLMQPLIVTSFSSLHRISQFFRILLILPKVKYKLCTYIHVAGSEDMSNLIESLDHFLIIFRMKIPSMSPVSSMGSKCNKKLPKTNRLTLSEWEFCLYI